MKIVIEAMQDSENVSGTDRIAFNVLRELQQLDIKNTYTVICARGYDYVPSGISAPNFRVVRRRVFRWRYLQRLNAPLREISQLYYKWFVRPNVQYTIRNLSSARIKMAPLVASALDVIPLIYKERYFGSTADYERFLASVRRTARLADRLIAISEHTKRDLVHYLEVAPDRVTVVGLATEPKFQVGDDEAAAKVRQRYHLPKRFILTMGSNEPRKNVQTVLQAYHGLPETVRSGLALVVLGSKWKGGSQGVELDDLDGVCFTGFADDADLPALYSAAEAFVYLSTYEGFGLPPLEAMACGTPVVASNTTSIPEATGKAALLVAPTDAAAATTALEQVLTNPAEARRLKAAGLARAAQFTWRATAEQILKVLVEVGGRG